MIDTIPAIVSWPNLSASVVFPAPEAPVKIRIAGFSNIDLFTENSMPPNAMPIGCGRPRRPSASSACWAAAVQPRTESLIGVSLIPGTLGVMVAKVHAVCVPRLQRKQHVQPACVNLIPFLGSHVLMRQQQICATLAIRSQFEPCEAAEVVDYQQGRRSPFHNLALACVAIDEPELDLSVD